MLRAVNWIGLMMSLSLGICLVALSQQPAEIPSKSPPHAPLKVASKAIPPTPERVHFLAFGDMGSGAPFQYQVAQRMVTLFEEDPYSHVLMLGDNLYPAGNVDQDGDRLFTKVYQPLLERQVIFLPALGNHDALYHHGDRMITFFQMPGHYYQETLGPVTVVVLDTNRFDAQQASWLRKTLAAIQTPWTIVYGHHPIVSSGEHGPNAHLIKTLKPILSEYPVAFYLAGHDHDYERFQPLGRVTPIVSGGGGAALDRGIQPTTNAFTPIVSGGGGAYLRPFAKVQPGSVVRVKTHHVLSLEATPTMLQVKAVNVDGQILDCLQLVRAVTPQPLLSKAKSDTASCEILPWQ